MNRKHLWFPLGLVLTIVTIFSCTVEPLALVPLDRVVVNQVSEDYFATISQDSVTLIRGLKDGGQVAATINYQAVTYEDIDSIQWVFTGATTDTRIAVNTLKPSVQYNGYGLFPAQLILTKYDTVSDNKITIRKDTIQPEEPVRIIFEERSWSETDWVITDVQSGTSWTPSSTLSPASMTNTMTTNSWTSFPFSNMVILNETQVQSEPIPYKRTAQFSGFSNQRLRLTFEYKVARKGGSQRFTGNNRKFDVVVDGFTRLQVNKTPNDSYQNAAISINDATDFRIELIKYPGMTRASWELTPTSLPAVCKEPETNVDTSPTSATASSATSSSSTSSSSTSSSTTTTPTATSTTPTTNTASGTTTSSGTTITAPVENVTLFQEYDSQNELFGFIEATAEKNFFFLNYIQEAGSVPYLFGTADQNTLSLTEPCPIELSEGKYKIFVYLDEGFPASFNAVRLPNTATYSSTVLDPNFFDLFIKNFKIEAY